MYLQVALGRHQTRWEKAFRKRTLYLNVLFVHDTSAAAEYEESERRERI